MTHLIDRMQAVQILGEAARGEKRPSELPASCRPSCVSEALAIQEMLVEHLAENVAGWKVATDSSNAALWGAILAPDCLVSPGKITGNRCEPLGIEGEIAFRFERDLPTRSDPYTRSEIEEVLVAFPAIEIVSSRFADYRQAPFLDRLADRMSNGGMVMGAPYTNWRTFDLAHLHVTQSIDETETLNQVGGHPKGDPLLPALDFIHARQTEKAFHKGQFITTGTFTGLLFAKSGQHITIDFQGFGAVSLVIG